MDYIHIIFSDLNIILKNNSGTSISAPTFSLEVATPILILKINNTFRPMRELGPQGELAPPKLERQGNKVNHSLLGVETVGAGKG